MVEITGVFGPAQRAGVLPGDALAAINGHAIADILDYMYHSAEAYCELSLSRAGAPLTVRVRKERYAALGLDFENGLLDQEQSCKNHCVFCFIDQNPPGMRESIYVKDDDHRLSVIFGNYITMTNLSDEDIQRILRLHISPINLSVHAVDGALRVKLMKNPAAALLKERLTRLCAGGIRVNVQLVLCPGLNDGAALRESLDFLVGCYPQVESIACVPVGLTGHRAGLTPLEPFNAATAAAVLDLIQEYGDRSAAQHGDRLVYPSDEFFILAGRELPPEDYYGDFLQIENGVGLTAMLRSEFTYALGQSQGAPLAKRVTVATGTAAAPLLKALLGQAEARFPGLTVQVVPIENRFFGGYITVAGLVTGRDLLEQLAGRDLGDRLLIPSDMLRHDGDLFLDDTPLTAVCETLGVPVRVVPTLDGAAFVAALTEFDTDHR